METKCIRGYNKYLKKYWEKVTSCAVVIYIYIYITESLFQCMTLTYVGESKNKLSYA